MSDPILDVRQLRAGYGDEDILHGVSITVTEGRIVAIIGPNGSGKSTLLKAIYGLIPIRAGAVSLAGTTACRTAPAPHHRARREPGAAAFKRVSRSLRVGRISKSVPPSTGIACASGWMLSWQRCPTCGLCSRAVPPRCPAANGKYSPSAAR